MLNEAPVVQSEDQDKVETSTPLLNLRHFVFFDRFMIIPTDTVFSTHICYAIDRDTLTAEMAVHIQIMHQNFPQGMIEHSIIYDISRPDRDIWKVDQSKLEKLSGDKYDNAINMKLKRADKWYMTRINKAGATLREAIGIMFVEGNIRTSTMDLLLEKFWISARN
jgi:hypothetical protein